MIVSALSRLKVTSDRRAFVDVALTAASEADARDFERIAVTLYRYYDRRQPIERLVRLGTLVAAYTAERRLVVPLAADHLVWTLEAERLAQSLLREFPKDLEVRGIELLISGTASERARAELAARDIELDEEAFGVVRASLAPAAFRAAARPR